MKRQVLAALGVFCGAALCAAGEFEPPKRLEADGASIRVESPGYAYPCWAEVGGKKGLVVGQFNKGKMRFFESLGGLKFGKGEWLQAEGKDAEVPGVW
jgi:hypothetical protein